MTGPDERVGTDGLRARLLSVMRRMDCQDLFDDAFAALVAYERALTEAQPVAPELDAERLRDAYDNVQNMNPLDYLDDGDMIDALVAEYARLTEPHRAEEETRS